MTYPTHAQTPSGTPVHIGRAPPLPEPGYHPPEMLQRIEAVMRRERERRTPDLEIARQIVEEMRIPTERMGRVDAAKAPRVDYRTTPPTLFYPFGAHVGASWGEMLDAALDLPQRDGCEGVGADRSDG